MPQPWLISLNQGLGLGLILSGLCLFMRSFWSEPFIWIHLAGLAVVPILLEVCALGLAADDPLLPVWLEFGLLVILGATPVLWMQLSRPFCIFSLLAIAIKPAHLSPSQRQILTLFKSRENPILAITMSVLLAGVLWRIYQFAPVAAPVTPFTQGRLVGLLVTAVAFLAANLFLQVPLSVLQVLITPEALFQGTAPYDVAQIQKDFTIPGWQVNQILPNLLKEPEVDSKGADPTPVSPSSREPMGNVPPSDAE